MGDYIKELILKFGREERLITIIKPSYKLAIGVFKTNHGDLYDVVVASAVHDVWHANMNRHNINGEAMVLALAELIN